MIDTIKTKAAQYLPDIISIRRHLHRHPELSFEEAKTSEYICSRLTQLGIPFTCEVAGFGIIATIKGQSDDKTIALRADMDALPIQELNEVTYRSEKKGVMHACGHDVHMSSLLGAAMILNDIKQSLPNSVRLIFQPGEEKLPGGASLMIKEGALENPRPEAIIAQHVFPSLETGKVGIRSGLYMASADEIYIEVIGKGGHAAMPQDCIDTILSASQIIVSLQQIVSRKNDASIPSVLSFGKFNSIGGATNIIPDRVLIEGTFRTMNETWRLMAHELIIHTAEMTAKAFGATCIVNIEKGYPFLINEPNLTQKVINEMKAYLGEKNVVDLPLRMTSEDFAFYSQVIPACFYRLGTGNKSKGITSQVHTPTFDIDEAALEIGMGLMAWLAFKH
ncbi:MAG: amidohydrolase [Saprospiraceae bacterium]|nr:amidohydrolase [Saprospiraceae bacterium]